MKNFVLLVYLIWRALVAELEDAPALGAGLARGRGSNPLEGTGLLKKVN